MSFRGMAVTVRSLDARVGGSFRFEVEDGSLITGTYLHIVPPEKLVFTWVGGIRQDMETVVTLDFLERDSVTEIVLTHEWLNTSEQRILAQGGWSSLLTALASILASDLDF